MQLYKILIGIFILAIIASGISIFMSNGVETYQTTGYDNTTFDSYNKMSDLNDKLEIYNSESGTVDSDSKDDKLGSLFTSVYQSAGVLKDSVGIFKSMISDGIDNMSPVLGGMGSILKIALTGIVFVAIIIGIFMHFITKSERN